MYILFNTVWRDHSFLCISLHKQALSYKISDFTTGIWHKQNYSSEINSFLVFGSWYSYSGMFRFITVYTTIIICNPNNPHTVNLSICLIRYVTSQCKLILRQEPHGILILINCPLLSAGLRPSKGLYAQSF
jgi:hypothetical protein